jgi:hypothetical protein
MYQSSAANCVAVVGEITGELCQNGPAESTRGNSPPWYFYTKCFSQLYKTFPRVFFRMEVWSENVLVRRSRWSATGAAAARCSGRTQSLFGLSVRPGWLAIEAAFDRQTGPRAGSTLAAACCRPHLVATRRAKQRRTKNVANGSAFAPQLFKQRGSFFIYWVLETYLEI